MAWVKCRESERCEVKICIHKGVHSSDTPSNCSEFEGRCKATGWVVKCFPVEIGESEKLFLVEAKEIYTQPYRVFAKTKEEAIRKVADGEVDPMEGYLEYYETLSPETWNVIELKEWESINQGKE